MLLHLFDVNQDQDIVMLDDMHLLTIEAIFAYISKEEVTSKHQ